MALVDYFTVFFEIMELYLNKNTQIPPTRQQFFEALAEIGGSVMAFASTTLVWLSPDPTSFIVKAAAVGSGASILVTLDKHWETFWSGFNFIKDTLLGNNPRSERIVIDKDLIQRIFNHMYCSMKDKTLTQFVWDTAVDNFPHEDGLEEAILGLVSKLYLESLNYADFLTRYAYYYDAIDAGFIPTTQCAPCEGAGGLYPYPTCLGASRPHTPQCGWVSTPTESRGAFASNART